MAKKQTKKEQQKVERATQVARRVAMMLFAACILGAAYWHTHSWIMDPATLPVKVVRIDGEIKYLQKEVLQAAVADRVTGGFFNIDLQAIMVAAQKVAWVDEVSVQRLWPDTVVMTIRERKAYARWGSKQLVTANGEVFTPTGDVPVGLPLLDGPVDRAGELVNRLHLEQQRFSSLDLVVDSIKINRRGSWKAVFGDGLEVAIGRHDVEKRLERLAESYQQIIRQGQPEYIDLRYQHGIAVAWKRIEPVKTEDKKGAV